MNINELKKLSGIPLSDPSELLYHVTQTNKISSIIKNGLSPMQTSNWIETGNKNRYGDGEIYAFEHELDAYRWAGRMDWEFFKKTGSGKISIVEFLHGEQPWEQDHNDPLSQYSRKGRWLKSIHGVPASQIIKSYPFTSEMAQKLVGAF